MQKKKKKINCYKYDYCFLDILNMKLLNFSRTEKCILAKGLTKKPKLDYHIFQDDKKQKKQQAHSNLLINKLLNNYTLTYTDMLYLCSALEDLRPADFDSPELAELLPKFQEKMRKQHLELTDLPPDVFDDFPIKRGNTSIITLIVGFFFASIMYRWGLPILLWSYLSVGGK